jgi:hypothetical protein
MLSVDGVNSTTANLELGAFYGNEVRGSTTAVYIPPLNSYLFFMTMFSNVAQQPIHFKLYNHETGEILILKETMAFTPDLHQGSVASPIPLTLLSTGITEANMSGKSLRAVPNPFNTDTNLQFYSNKDESVEIAITDVCGNLVTTMELNAFTGLNTVEWNSTKVKSGIYLAHLKTSSGVLSCRLVKQ